jgi:hypothetical protein
MKALLAGKYEYPPEFVEATKEIFQKCTNIWLMVPPDLVKTEISEDDWRSHWVRI